MDSKTVKILTIISNVSGVQNHLNGNILECAMISIVFYLYVT